MAMMKMSFFFGYQCSLLFTSFNLETPGRKNCPVSDSVLTVHQFFLPIILCNVELFGGVLLVLIIGILYEGLKTLREILAAKEQPRNANDSVNMEEKTLLIPPQSREGTGYAIYSCVVFIETRVLN